MAGKRVSSSKDRVLTAVNLAQPDRVPMSDAGMEAGCYA